MVKKIWVLLFLLNNTKKKKKFFSILKAGLELFNFDPFILIKKKRKGKEIMAKKNKIK